MSDELVVPLPSRGNLHTLYPLPTKPVAFHGAVIPFLALTARPGTNVAGTFNPNADTLLASLFELSVATTLEAIAMYCVGAGGAGSVFRFGIYANTQNGDLYPGAALYRSGQLAGDVATTVRQETGLGVQLKAFTYYWALLLPGVNAPNLRSIGGPGDLRLGFATPATATTNPTNLTAALAYGALPANAPAGMTLVNGGTTMALFGRAAAS